MILIVCMFSWTMLVISLMISGSRMMTLVRGWIKLWLVRKNGRLGRCITLMSRNGSVRGHLSFSLPLLSSPTTPSTPPVHMYIPHTSVTPRYHLQGPYQKPTTFIPEGPTTFQRSTHQMSSTFSLLPHSYLRRPRHIGTGLCNTTAPSAIMWIPIYGRLGTGRLGTVILCISFVV
jgi:hypothetical protein